VRLVRAERLHDQQAALAETANAQTAALAEQVALLEPALRTGDERRAALEAAAAQAHAEIEALRQQSEDRGVLAHQASELGRTVVELEQQLAAQRGGVARAERERAAVIEELEETRRAQAEAEAVAAQRASAQQTLLDRLADEQRRLETESAARLVEAEAARALLAEERAASEALRADHRRAQEEGQDAARRLSETHRRLEDLSAALARRDAAVEAGTNERQRLTVQITKLAAQLRVAQETLVAAEGRSALERAAAEADRDTWKAQALSVNADVERLTAHAAELIEATARLESQRGAAAAENAALRAALDEARANHRQTETAVHADLTAAQRELERLSADLVAQRAALADRDEQLTALRREQDGARARDVEWQQTAAALRAEVAARTVELRDSAAERQELREARDTLERQLAAASATRARDEQAAHAAREQISLLEGERMTLRAALDDLTQQAAKVDAVHAAVLDEFRGDVATLKSQLAVGSAERASLAEKLQQAEQAITAGTAHAEHGRQQAAALADRCEHLEQTLAAAEARRAGLDGELVKARGEIEALRVHSADRGALAHQASELESRVRHLEEQLATQLADSTRIERQRRVLEEQLRAARERQEAAAVAAEREQATLRDTLTRTQEEHRQLDAAYALQANVAEALGRQVAELRTARDALAAELEGVRAAGQDGAHRLAETQQQMEELNGLLQQREAFFQTVTAEREGLAATTRKFERTAAELADERDQLRRTVTELTARLEQERHSHSEEKAALARDLAAQRERQPHAGPPDGSEGTSGLPPEVVAETVPLYQEPLAIERSAPLGALVEGTAEPLDALPQTPVRPHKVLVPTGELVLLDDGVSRDAACAALSGAGFEVATFPPTEAGVDAMLRRKVKCIMLNVGGGVAAWRTLRVLRERVGSRSLPILAYAMTQNAPAGFCFGRADFGLWPMDPARMIERLECLRPKLKRLLLLSADVDGMGRLREPLAAAKISTSLVLDGKQALEFATMVEPEAAILHLSPNCPSVSRAVAGLRAMEATRDLPLLLVLDKTAAPREDAFFAATTVQLVSKPAFRFTNLPEEIARVVG
jgi:chromosome segregation ATPase